jgi:hypothetical protein
MAASTLRAELESGEAGVTTRDEHARARSPSARATLHASVAGQVAPYADARPKENAA